MSELGLFIKNDTVMVSSLKVAENYGKRHDVVARGIKTLIESVPECALNFVVASYEDAQGKTRPCYEMDRQGFSMLVMGFTGAEAKKFTYEYTRAFETMLQERQKSTQLTQASTGFELTDGVSLELQMCKCLMEDAIKKEARINQIEEDIKEIKEQKTNEILIPDNSVINLSKRSQYEIHNIYSPTQIGAAFGLSGLMLNRILYVAGLQYPYPHNAAWLIAKRHRDSGLSKQMTRVLPHSRDGAVKEHTIGWTKKGVELITKILKERGYEQISDINNKLKARKPYKRKSYDSK